jgi:hypothetical protein
MLLFSLEFGCKSVVSFRAYKLHTMRFPDLHEGE